jgi:Flp pilus assembly protein TadD
MLLRRALASAVLAECVLLSAIAWAGDVRWVEVRSPRFSVITDAGEKRGREVALRFEQMRAVFGKLLVKAKVSQTVPLQIVAFRNTKEMRQFAPLWHGKPTEVAGLFQGGSDRSYIMLDLSVFDPYAVVFHEYAHQLLNANLGFGTPLWFDEGFAEYFSSIEIDGKNANVGKPVEHAAFLRDTKRMKVADLFQVQHDSGTYNESGDHRSLFYAESWLVVHYLFDTNAAPKLGQYLELRDQGRPLEEAFSQAFGLTPAAFDKALSGYIDRNRYVYYKMPLPEVPDSSAYTMAPLSDPQAKAVTADIHLHSPDYRERALREFEEVLHLDPDNVTALSGVGYSYLQRQDYAKASEFFRRAAQHDAKDARIHYYAGLLVQREGPAAGNDPEKMQEMKRELETAVALDPDFADAYNLLAIARMTLDDRAGAIAAGTRALQLDPRNSSYALNLAQMLTLAQKWDEAIALLKTLSRSSDPTVAERAQSQVQQVENLKQYAAQGAELKASGGVMMVRQGATVDLNQSAGGEDGPPGAPQLPPAGPVRYLKGKLTAVECSGPGAVLTVAAAGQNWKLLVRDREHLVLIGADKLSCDWTNQKVAVNLRDTGPHEGQIISLEVQ